MLGQLLFIAKKFLNTELFVLYWLIEGSSLSEIGILFVGLSLDVFFLAGKSFMYRTQSTIKSNTITKINSGLLIIWWITVLLIIIFTDKGSEYKSEDQVYLFSWFLKHFFPTGYRNLFSNYYNAYDKLFGSLFYLSNYLFMYLYIAIFSLICIDQSSNNCKQQIVAFSLKKKTGPEFYRRGQIGFFLFSILIGFFFIEFTSIGQGPIENLGFDPSFGKAPYIFFALSMQAIALGVTNILARLYIKFY